MFEIGKKVVCIDDKFPKVDGYLYHPPKKPARHEVLTVSMIYDHIEFGLFLSFGKFNTPKNNCFFIAKHFRPIEDLPNFQEQAELQTQQERIEIQQPIFT